MLNETSEKKYKCCLLWTFERVLPDSSEHQYCFLYINKFGIYIVGILLSAKSKNKAKHMLPCTSCSFQYNGMKLKILTNVSERVDVSTLCGLAGNLLTSHGLAPSQLPPVILPKERYGPQEPVFSLHQNPAPWAEMVSKAPSTWKESGFVFSSAVLPHGRYFVKWIC